MIDTRSGFINRQWYTFFLKLFDLVDAGRNTWTLTDIQQAPPVIPYAPPPPPSPAIRGKFLAYKNTPQALSPGFDDPVSFQVETYDETGDYNPATGVFTATVAGEWIIGAAVSVTGQSDGNAVRLDLRKGGAFYARIAASRIGAVGVSTVSGTVPVTLAAGETLQVMVYTLNAATASDGVGMTFFTGVRVR